LLLFEGGLLDQGAVIIWTRCSFILKPFGKESRTQLKNWASGERVTAGRNLAVWRGARRRSIRGAARTQSVGVDSLNDSSRQALCFKVAQSVADFEDVVLCEHEGLHGTDSYLDLEGIRQVTNSIRQKSICRSRFNYDGAINLPPDWINQPYWPYFHYYADYVRRLSFMNESRRGTILLYYPRPQFGIWTPCSREK
jgi:hypothetical protein